LGDFDVIPVRGDAGGFAVEGVGVAGDSGEVLGDCGQVVCHERRMIQIDSLVKNYF
jgi:hypothetical protein